MNVMPGFAPKPGDLTRHDPSMLPYSIVPEKANSCRGTLYNAALDPIGTIEAHSKSQLNEIARNIESAFRERDALLDEVRSRSNNEQRAAQRNVDQRRGG